MLRQASRLVPFERSVTDGLQITAELVWKSDGWLELSYGLLAQASSGLSPLLLPKGLLDGTQRGEQRDELWTTTCFEAFLAVPGESRYWEINLAANGDWAAYSFDDYRSGQRPQALISEPAVRLRRWHHQLRLDARLPLKPWWPAGVCPELSLSAVIDRGAEGLSHWALDHGDGADGDGADGEEADFHQRSTFLRP